MDVNKLIEELTGYKDSINDSNPIEVSYTSNPIVSIYVPKVSVNSNNSTFKYYQYNKFERGSNDGEKYKLKFDAENNQWVEDRDNKEDIPYRENKISYNIKHKSNVGGFYSHNDFMSIPTDYSSIKTLNGLRFGDYIFKQHQTYTTTIYDNIGINVNIGQTIFNYSENLTVDKLLNQLKYEDNYLDEKNDIVMLDNETALSTELFMNVLSNMSINNQVRYISFVNAMHIGIDKLVPKFTDYITTYFKKFNEFEYAVSAKKINIDSNWSLISEKEMSLKPFDISIGEDKYLLEENEEKIYENFGELAIGYIGNTIRRSESVGSFGNIINISSNLDGNDEIDKIYNDRKIAYGKNYTYFISPLIEIHQTYVDDQGYIRIARAYVEAHKSTPLEIVTKEYIPPLPPTDFNISVKNNVAFLTWGLPKNTQRDIKKFNIYKRSNVDQPFSLLMQYDFRDWKNGYGINKNSTIIANYGTPIDEIRIPSVFEQMDNPKTFFKDNNFFEGDIYALTCVDAHEMESNYSTQLKIEPFKRGYSLAPKVSRLSQQGAPLAYPNWFLNNRDEFTKSIKKDKFCSIKIELDPDVKSVLDMNAGSWEEKLRIYSEGKENNKYTLSILNTDLMCKNDIEFKIIEKIPAKINNNLI